MLNKTEKAVILADMKDRFTRSKGVMLTEYKGLTSNEMTELRSEMRSSGLEYKVVKNTLARIASDGTPVAVAQEHFTGPLGLAITYTDAAQAAKSVLAYAKKNNKFVVQGGVVEGKYCDMTELKKIADLPSREVLLSMMAGTFQAPASKTARLLQATVVRFAYAINALKEKREKSAA